MPYYEEAKTKNEELVEGQVVDLELDVQERDKYGRLLAYVWLDSGIMVNAELLRTGYAQILTIPLDVRYQDQFFELQGQAREAELGLWGLEEVPQATEAEPKEEITAAPTQEVTPEQPAQQPTQGETTEEQAAPPPQEPPAEPTEPATNCDPSYPDVCIPIGSADYDCAGGSGNGPNYIRGPIRVLPPDPHGLDRDGDGIGCE